MATSVLMLNAIIGILVVVFIIAIISFIHTLLKERRIDYLALISVVFLVLCLYVHFSSYEEDVQLIQRTEAYEKKMVE